MNRCLYCYQKLNENEIDFHSKCSKKIFGLPLPPIVPYNENEMSELASKIINKNSTVAGVQPKLSLSLTSNKELNEFNRFTIIGLMGNYFLKPQTVVYPHLPEIEDLTMKLASIAKIKVVPHSLIRLQSGNLAYITKRIDRYENGKIHMEDFCQLTERLTEDKYHGSHEQIVKVIRKFANKPGLDTINFYEQVLFAFLTGNADMHLKNFSFIYENASEINLSPAYDMVATILVNPLDDEELALTLNGRKKKISKRDFEIAFTAAKLDKKQQENIFNKMVKARAKWIDLIGISFLTAELKSKYVNLIHERFQRLSI
jgi:serine/threonine-protein kinase HipA